MRKTALLALACLPFAAHGADLGAATGFNAFVFGSASLNGGHADGAIAIGGSVSGSSYSTLLQNAPAAVGTDTHVGFYVGGNAAFTDKLTVNNGGNARVGGVYQGANGITLNGGGTLIQGPGAVDASLFTNQYAYSTAQSGYLFGLAATPITTTDPNNWSVNAANVATAYGTAKLVSIPGSALSLLRTLDISNLGTGTLIINVTGASPVTGFGLTLNGAAYDHVLWNYGGSSLSIGDRAMHGSLLAPYAAVTMGQNLDGNLVAGSWTNNNSVELHFGTGTRFAGFVPSAQPTPEPGTWAALGLGATAALRRRRR